MAPAPDGAIAADDRLRSALLNLALSAEAQPDTSLEGLANRIVQQAHRMMPDVECVLAIVSVHAPGVFTVVAGAGDWGKSKVGGQWPVEGTLNGRALMTQKTVDTETAPSDSATPEVFGDEIRIGRLVPILGAHPLPDGRTVLGVLGFWRADTPFDVRERELIDAFASHASLALVAQEARRVADLISERLTFAHRLSLDLQASLVPKEIIHRLLQTTLSVVKADRATLSTVDEEIITIEATLGSGGEPTWVGRTYGSEFFEVQPEVAEAIRRKRPTMGGAMDVDQAAPEFRAVLAQTKHTLTVPLIVSDRAVGLLVLSRIEDIPFNDADLDLMQLIGGIAALALRNARQFEQINQAAQAKSDFLNMAAHELRTPMTVVQGYLDLLRGEAFGALPDAAKRPVDLVAGKAAELGSLVQNILDAARMQGAPPVLPTAVFDLRSEVAAAVDRAEARRSLLRGTLTFEPPPSAVEVEAGRGYVGRVLDNLINNAMAYQGEEPWVRITLTAGDSAQVLVEDHGLGIPLESRPHIFKQFYRIDLPPWNQAAGTGLGLYLSRRNARAAGGDLELVDTPSDGGATFSLTLPLAAPTRTADSDKDSTTATDG